MKKNLLLILSLLSISFSAGAQTCFEEDFSDEDALDRFTLYDEAGNISRETDVIGMATENFTYSNRNFSYGGHTAAYDLTGNITRKSDAGSTFSYGIQGKPYAVSGISTEGNAIPQRNQTIAYTSFKRPDTIAEGAYNASFVYNAGGDRVKMEIKKDGNSELRRYYLAGQYELDEGTAGTKEKLYLGGDYYSAFAVYVKENGGNWQVYYICRDYLGSITHITNSGGSVVQQLSYDAWGRLRNPANQTAYAPDTEPALFLGRGYTGHEHLAMFGLVNMNARLYDPAVGRFLSPDPFVQAPDFSQNFNRYSYALNNPLKFTDPNGKVLHIIIGAVVGGIINLGIKVYQGKINSWRDGFVAFGIGAAAGAIGAATGGAAFAAAGGAAGGVGGFLAGAAGGAVGTAFSSPILSMGNSAYFGDPMMTGKQYLMGIAGGALLGGSINGITALANGRNFWNGNLSSNTTPVTPTIQPTPNQQSNNANTQPNQNSTQTPAEKMSQVREMGRAAEEAVGIDPNIKQPIRSLTETANYRIPDRLTPFTLEEVKNVSRLDYTPQIQDFVKYSQKNNLQMILHIRPAGTIYGAPTQLSPTMRNLYNQGMFLIFKIPF